MPRKEKKAKEEARREAKGGKAGAPRMLAQAEQQKDERSSSSSSPATTSVDNSNDDEGEEMVEMKAGADNVIKDIEKDKNDSDKGGTKKKKKKQRKEKHDDEEKESDNEFDKEMMRKGEEEDDEEEDEGFVERPVDFGRDEAKRTIGAALRLGRFGIFFFSVGILFPFMFIFGMLGAVPLGNPDAYLFEANGPWVFALIINPTVSSYIRSTIFLFLPLKN